MENEVIKADQSEVVGKPDAAPAHAPVAKPVAEPVVKPAAKPAANPVASPVTEASVAPIVKANEKSEEKSAIVPSEKKNSKTDDKPKGTKKDKTAGKSTVSVKPPKAETPRIKKTKREKVNYELRIDLLGKAIKKARKERKLTQKELGQLVGVKKAQISKLENSLTDARFETIIKVFKALNVKLNFTVELIDQVVRLD